MFEDKERLKEIQRICLLAGHLMIEGGSEMSRVEDTMLRIARNAGVSDPQVFATPTGVFLTLDSGQLSQIEQVRERNINLELVDRVNNLSRQFANKEINLQELDEELHDVATNTAAFPLWLQLIGAASLSSTLMILFFDSYDWLDFPAAAIVGCLGFLVYYFIQKYTRIRFLSELIAAMFMALLTYLIRLLVPECSIDKVLVGALMTLVPGLALTNALRDLFAGDLMSGIGRFVEAVMTALALGGGVGIIMRFLGA